MKNVFRKRECEDESLRKTFSISPSVENIFRKYSSSHLLFQRTFSIIQKLFTENVFIMKIKRRTKMNKGHENENIIMKIKRRTKMNKGHENENIIMKIKKRTKMNKRHENEYMLSVFFCVYFIQNKELNIYKYCTHSRYS